MNEWRDTLGLIALAGGYGLAKSYAWDVPIIDLMLVVMLREIGRYNSWWYTPQLVGSNHSSKKNISASLVSVYFNAILVPACNFVTSSEWTAGPVFFLAGAVKCYGLAKNLNYIGILGTYKAYAESMWDYPRKSGGPTITNKISTAAKNVFQRMSKSFGGALPQPARNWVHGVACIRAYEL